MKKYIFAIYIVNAYASRYSCNLCKNKVPYNSTSYSNVRGGQAWVKLLKFANDLIVNSEKTN